jgi:hypothetical protein
MPEEIALMAVGGGEAAASTAAFYGSAEAAAATSTAMAGAAGAEAALLPLGVGTVPGWGGAAGVDGAVSGVAGAAAAEAAGGASFLSKLGDTAVNAGASAAVSSLLSPKRNASNAPSAEKLPPLIGMPDPLAQEEARKRALIEQMSRRGRASTIMTQPSDGRLGG